jgi:hypothetical protein
LALVAGCGSIEDPNAPGAEDPSKPGSSSVQEVTGAVAVWPGEAQSSCGDRILFSRFNDNVGSRAGLETRALLTSPQAYLDYFGHPAPAGVDLNREWVVFYSAGRKGAGSTADVSVVGAQGDVLRVVTTLTGPIPPCVPPVMTDPAYPMGGPTTGAGGSSGGGSTGSSGGAPVPTMPNTTPPSNPPNSSSPVAPPGSTVPAMDAGVALPPPPAMDAGVPQMPPATDAGPPMRGPQGFYVLVKFAAQKTRSVDFQHQDINPGCNVDPVPSRCTSSNQCGKGLRCSTERGDCQGCGAGPGVACPAVCFGVCEPAGTPTNPCAATLCAPDQQCVVLESYPPRAQCVPAPKPNACFGGLLMGGCRSEDEIKAEATKLCEAQMMFLTDFGVGNACFAGGFVEAKYACCNTAPPPPPPPACKVDSDCETTSYACGVSPCTCSVRAKNQPQDSCALPAIACLVDPCKDQKAVCVKNQCNLVRATP